MTNKEKYKQAFSGLHPLEPISLEVTQMVKMQRNTNFKSLLQSLPHHFSRRHRNCIRSKCWRNPAYHSALDSRRPD